MLGQKPCQRANYVSGAPCKVFSMFSEAPDAPVRRLLVVVFVPTQQMFSGSVVRTLFCAQRTAGIVLFFVFLVLVTRQSCVDPARMRRFLLFTVRGSIALSVRACVSLLCIEGTPMHIQILFLAVFMQLHPG